MRPIKLIENPSEIGAGTRGSSLGPAAMRIAALKAGSLFYSKHQPHTIADLNALLHQPKQHTHAFKIEGVSQIYDRISASIKSALSADEFPVVIAGDHSSAGGTIAGIKSQYPEKQLGVIWVDAHADLHSPYTTPSGNVHGMPLATALGFDNGEAGINEISAETQQAWNELKNKGGIKPKITPDCIVLIGVRDTEPPEDHLIEKFGIKKFAVGDVRSEGAIAIAQQALAYLEACDMIYVSFDIDSLDSEISMGTGTPVSNGLQISEAKQLLHEFAKEPKLKCLEIVEVNPTLDNKGNLMAEIAFDLLESTVEILEKGSN